MGRRADEDARIAPALPPPTREEEEEEGVEEDRRIFLNVFGYKGQ